MLTLDPIARDISKFFYLVDTIKSDPPYQVCTV